MIVGEDPASQVYVANKHKACEEVGMESVHHGLPAETSEAELLDLVERLGPDDAVDGILVQLPVPRRSTPTRSSPRSTPARTSTG